MCPRRHLGLADEPPASPPCSESYHDTPFVLNATTVAVTAANNTPGIDFRLERAGAIAGHVYESDAVMPIANLRVYALDFTTDQWMATTNTLPVSSSTTRTIL